MTKYCPNCGDELIDDANFCKSCGSQIGDASVNAYGQTYHSGEKTYTIAVIIGYIAAVLIPIIGVIIGIYLWTRKDSSDSKHGKYMIIVAAAVWIVSILTLNVFF